MAGVFNLKVTPEALDSKARNVEGAVSKMQMDFLKMQAAMQDTRGFWRGQGGDIHRRMYEDRIQEINEILAKLRAYTIDLRKMAGTYRATEEQNKVFAARLESSIIGPI
ncbi:MAG: WXG100 family type VII secretion target [Lachnospiraceae bacterium]|nr:WXG100 family type VII secretion target [Lachnospiraceae bacterium]